MMTSLIVNWQNGRLTFSGPATGKSYEWILARDGVAVEVEEADVPGLLQLTFAQGCGCAGGTGNNEIVNYFRRP